MEPTMRSAHKGPPTDGIYRIESRHRSEPLVLHIWFQKQNRVFHRWLYEKLAHGRLWIILPLRRCPGT